LSGVATITGKRAQIDLDKNSEFAYGGSYGSGESYSISQGRSWIEAKGDILIELKHLRAKMGQNDIALIEQQRIYSIVHVLQGDIEIETAGREPFILGAGKRIMISQSNLLSPGTTMESLSGPIDISIEQNPLFISKDGKKLLRSLISASGSMMISGSGTLVNQSGSVIDSEKSGQYILISSPKDGGVITGSTLIVSGKILRKEVSRLVINEKSVIASTDKESFESLPIAINSDTVDVVYKAFDSSGNLLERGLLTLKASVNGADKLVPKTFPTNDKDFRITSPTENPFKTTASSVTVSGNVPKETVEYITVNNFRLKKFTPYSTNWYYYANTAYQTMKEGFNLYEIRFYGKDDTLLSTQLFTIIKE
jgi:hypothetical protein